MTVRRRTQLHRTPAAHRCHPQRVIVLILLGGLAVFGCGKPYPTTPEMLIAEFWKAANRNDQERLTDLCPGIQGEKLRLLEGTTPSSKIRIRAPRPYPYGQGLEVWPVVVPIPGHGNRTYDMVIGKTEEGRLFIDYERTFKAPGR